MMKYTKPIVWTLFVVVALLFFAVLYPYHVHYQEQYQLFLFTSRYAAEVTVLPGGLADYIGRFFTQFFLFPWTGAVILALLFGFVQLLTWLNMRNRSLSAYFLSFLPAIALWVFFCRESALLGAVVAVVLCLLAAWLVRSRWLALVVFPLLYWACGPLALLFAAVKGCASEEHRRIRTPRFPAPYFLIAALLLFSACIALARYEFSYPLESFIKGVHYHRYRDSYTIWPWVASALAAVLCIWQPNKRPEHRLAPCLVVALVVAVSTFAVRSAADFHKEEVLAYDYMARMKMWNRIIETASRKAPNNSMGVTALNLALAKKDLLAERMFHFIQNRREGLLPAFVRDYSQPLLTAEAYYQLGMTYQAQQYVYEAMEAIPDYQKSARCYKRLAEINLIHGSYEVARKYLTALQHTWMYRRWANQTLELMADEQAINKHPEYGWLRRCQYANDFFISDQEMASMLGQLYLSNPQNKLAFHYLMAWSMLNGEVEQLGDYVNLAHRTGGMEQIPTLYQQALVMAWAMSHDGPQGMPWPIDSKVLNAFQQFVAQQRANAPLGQMEALFGNTYWYYYFYKMPQL